MRVSLKVIGACVIGSAIAALVPAGNAFLTALWSRSVDILTIPARYVVYPFFFFAIAVSVGRLKRAGALGKTLRKGVGIGVICSLGMAILGALIGLIAPLERIPIAFEHEVKPPFTIGWDVLERLFPHNFFSVVTQFSPLPLCIAAFILGLNFAFDREAVEPAFNLFDSLSRVFYRAASFYVRFAYIPALFMAGSFVYALKSEKEIGLYLPFFALALISGLVVFIGVYTLIYRNVCKGSRPFEWMRGAVASPILGLITPDFNASVLSVSYLSHENSGVKRNLAGSLVPMYALFMRSGVAFVSAMALVTILKSYSTLNVTFMELLLVIFFSFAASFLVSGFPVFPLQTALAIACAFYGKDIDAGAYILTPIFSQLAGVASMLDILTMLFCLRLISGPGGFERRNPRRKFV